jgi:soluble lytic murein transglycosylase-like protein
MLVRSAVAVFCLFFAIPAQAQIYAWHDSSGNLVLSDKRRPGQTDTVTSYGAPSTVAVRATGLVAAERTREYDDLIQEHAHMNGVRTDLVRAVIQVESGFNPMATSPKGAVGLMQLMPATIRQFGVGNPFSPRENVRAGVAYLRQLLDRYSDNEELALAAYNAGPAAVDRHGQAIPPFSETRQYVAKVSGLAGPIVARAPGTQLYRIPEIVEGREVVLYSNNPNARVNPAALPPSDPSARTPGQVLQSSSVFRAP